MAADPSPDPVPGVLRQLDLDGTGPADRLTFGPLAERLNVVAGDNGLGKSFLLDLSWWALTRTWAARPAVPRRPDATIGFTIDGLREVSPWVPATQGWKRKPGRPPIPALVVYARGGGSFSVWDPCRSDPSPGAFHFAPGQVLDPLRSPEGQVVCRGLIDDWTRWQATGDPRFSLLTRMLAALSEDPARPMTPGKPARAFLGDLRDLPTLRMPYGDDVPLLIAAAGTRRLLELGYLLTWAFSEHEAAARRRGLALAEQVILLVDEPESHLHPRWQREVLAGLLAAIASWRDPAPRVQLIATTHSPLVLASLEPIFDVARDALWKLDLVGSLVTLEKDAWRKRGDVNRWLTSHVIGLGMPTSPAAEDALQAASRLLRAPIPDPAEVARVDARLHDLLPEMDPFLVRWRYFLEQRPGSQSA